MPNHTLGEVSVQEIKAAMDGLRGRQAKFQAARLADQYHISLSRIYSLTEDVRPQRKERSDKGKRVADVLGDEGLRFAAELVVTRNLDAELAIEAAQLNGYSIEISVPTFRRYLRELGISAADNIRDAAPYRNWSASAPGEMFQLDLSGVKQRWLDIRTRGIYKLSSLEVSTNHPNANPFLIPIWKISLIDDYSRFKRVRFIATPKPTSKDVIDFLLAAYREMGIPKLLYSDNDSIIKGKRMQRAARILNEAFKDSGGYQLTQHLPGNAKATGKVERTHKTFEKFEKLIGCLYDQPTIENLNTFSERTCERMNWKEHRVTREIPTIRFRQTTTALRIPPPALLDAAFKVDEFEKLVRGNMTIEVETNAYQLPRQRPFTDWIGKKIIVLWPPDATWFGVIGLDGTEYTLERKLWAEDLAGDFKSPQESTRQRTVKAIKNSADERRKSHKAKGTRPLVPLFDSQVEAAAGRPLIMPQRKDEMDAARLAALAPGAMPPEALGQPIDLWSAAMLLIEEGHFSKPASVQDKAWLHTVFANRDEILDTELRAALALRATEIESVDIRKRA